MSHRDPVSDLTFSSTGSIVTLRRARSDEEVRSRRIGSPFGSSRVRSVKAWLEATRITENAILRSLDRV